MWECAKGLICIGFDFVYIPAITSVFLCMLSDVFSVEKKADRLISHPVCHLNWCQFRVKYLSLGAALVMK